MIRFDTTSSKGSHISSASMSFLGSGVNYMKELANGDWVLLYAFTNYADFTRVLNKVNNILFGTSSTGNNSTVSSTPDKIATANGFNDGLKFVGRIASITRQASKEPETGRRHVFYNVSANGFTEFDTSLYYNQYLATQYQDMDSFLLNVFAVTLTDFQANHDFINGSEVVPLLIDILMGIGPQDAQDQNITINKNKLVATVNDVLRIPTTIVNLLIGSSFSPQNPAGFTYADLLVSTVGVQQWNSKPSYGSLSNGPEFGFNSAFTLVKPNRYEAGRLTSQFLVTSVQYNNTTPWAFLNHFVNDPIEEVYTCLRLDSLGRVMPTLVVRQTVLNTDNFIQKLQQQYQGVQATSFFSVPRWNIDQSLVISEDFTKSEAHRANFVYLYGEDPTGVNPASQVTNIMSKVAPYYDSIDIQRYGLKMFDKQQIPVEQVSFNGGFDTAYWSGLMADQLMGGQEKISGGLTTYGIQEPICEGDNLSYDSNLYQIERIMHHGVVEGEEGHKKFTTSFDLSNGLALQQPSTGVAYPVLKPFAPSSETLPISEVDLSALQAENETVSTSGIGDFNTSGTNNNSES